MPFSQSVGNQVIGMNTDMPVLETNFLHIKPFTVATDNFTFQKFAFPHDSSLLLINYDYHNDEKSRD